MDLEGYLGNCFEVLEHIHPLKEVGSILLGTIGSFSFFTSPL